MNLSLKFTSLPGSGRGKSLPICHPFTGVDDDVVILSPCHVYNNKINISHSDILIQFSVFRKEVRNYFQETFGGVTIILRNGDEPKLLRLVHQD